MYTQVQIDQNSTAGGIALGSPQTWKQDNQEANESLEFTGKVECYANDRSSTTAGSVEFSPLMNPRTGCEDNIEDPFKNTTGFQRDNLYNDVTRYDSTNAISHFTQTFPSSNLQGDQLVVASSALDLEERGKAFKIRTNMNEGPLITFCQTKGWNYYIVQDTNSTVKLPQKE